MASFSASDESDRPKNPDKQGNKERKSLFDHFAAFMNLGLVRYLGYFNEIAAAVAESFHPEKKLNPNKWNTKGYPTWFKALNATTWAYVGLDVLAKAGEAYKQAKNDDDPTTNPVTMWVKTALDRGIFQAAATIVIPVKIIHGIQHAMDKSLKGKMSHVGLRNLKLAASILPIPLIAAFVDYGVNAVLDRTLRPLLGLPKHVMETHGKPLEDVVAEHHNADTSQPDELLGVSAISSEQRFQPTSMAMPLATYPSIQAANSNPFAAPSLTANTSNYPVAQSKFQQFVR